MKYEDVMTLGEMDKIKYPNEDYNRGDTKALVQTADGIAGVKTLGLIYSHGMLPRVTMDVELIDVLPEDAPEPTIFQFKTGDPQ